MVTAGQRRRARLLAQLVVLLVGRSLHAQHSGGSAIPTCRDPLASNYVGPAIADNVSAAAAAAEPVGAPACEYDCTALAAHLFREAAASSSTAAAAGTSEAAGGDGSCYADPATRWLACTAEKTYVMRGGEPQLDTDSLYAVAASTDLMLHGRWRLTAGSPAAAVVPSAANAGIAWDYTPVGCRLRLLAGSRLGLRAVAFAGRRSMQDGGAVEAVEAVSGQHSRSLE